MSSKQDLAQGCLAEYTFRTDAKFPKEKRPDGRLFYQRGKDYLNAMEKTNYKHLFIIDLFSFANRIYQKHQSLRDNGQDYQADSVWGALKVVEDEIKQQLERISN